MNIRNHYLGLKIEGLKQINSEIDTVVKTGHMIFMLTLMWGLLQFLHGEFFKLEVKILGSYIIKVFFQYMILIQRFEKRMENFIVLER